MRLKRDLAVSLTAAALLLAVSGPSASAQYVYPSSPSGATGVYPTPTTVVPSGGQVMMLPVVVYGVSSPPAYPYGAAAVSVQPATIPAIPLSQGVTGQGEIDRLLAAAETSEEVRIVLARHDRWRRVAEDPLLRQFLRERFTAPEIASSSALTREYRVWLVETLLERGPMIEQSGVVPNFRLLPAVQAASWPTIWSRSFAPPPPALTGVARVHTHGHPHAHLRAAPSARSSILARFTAGTEVTVHGHEGAWLRVSAHGMTGYLLSSEVTHSHEYGPRYTGPESIIYYQRMTGGTWEGYDSNFGWVYPPHSQTVGAARTMGVVSEAR